MTTRKKYDKMEVTYPFAFRKLPYHIQHSSQHDYRWVEYDYASFMAKKWGIKSARQWRSFVQFFNPAGMPSNPDRVYHKQWMDWPTFLNTTNSYTGYDPASVRAWELLPYDDAVQWTQSQQFATVDKFLEAFDAGLVPKGIPRCPHVRYTQFWPKGGWKYFLGKKLSSVVIAKKNTEAVCALCQTVGASPNILSLVINSNGGFALREQLEANPTLTAIKAYYWHHDYGTYIFELLDKMGTKQGENSWLFSDVNSLYYELGSVLEVYRPR